jgi:protein TonB
LTGRALNTALAALTREEFYPREAIARGLEGRVVLLLTLDTAGTVTAFEVASSSGHPMLDGAALKAAMRIGSLPGGRLQVLLPVEFRLE